MVVVQVRGWNEPRQAALGCSVSGRPTDCDNGNNVDDGAEGVELVHTDADTMLVVHAHVGHRFITLQH